MKGRPDGWRDCGAQIYRLCDGGRDVAAIWPMVKGGWFVGLRLGDQPETVHECPSEEAARSIVGEALQNIA